MPRKVTKNVDEFVRRLKENKTQRKVELSKWKIGMFQWGRVCRALRKNESVKFLELHGDGAYFHRLLLRQTRSLAKVIAKNKSMVSIAVTGKAIGDEGATAIAKGLRASTTLQALDIGTNNFSKPGIGAIATALRYNTTLAALSLRGNNVNRAATLAFVKCLGVKASLTALDLSLTGFDDKCCKVLGAAMLENRSVTDINLSDNPIRSRGALILADASLRNPTWHFLKLSGGRLPLLYLKGTGFRTDAALAKKKQREVVGLTIDGPGNEAEPDAAAAHAGGTSTSGTSAGHSGVGESEVRGGHSGTLEHSDASAVPPGRSAPLLRVGAGETVGASAVPFEVVTTWDNVLPGYSMWVYLGGKPTDNARLPLPGSSATRVLRQSQSRKLDGSAATRSKTVTFSVDGESRNSGAKSDARHANMGEDGNEETKTFVGAHASGGLDSESVVSSDHTDDDSARRADKAAAREEALHRRAAAAAKPPPEPEDEELWIDLSDKGLTVEDVVVIGRLLWGNSSTTALDLSLNDIAGPDGKNLDGIFSLCEAIKVNTTLNMLDLQESNLSDEAAAHIAAAATHSQNLELIRFDEAELPVQVISGRLKQESLDLRTPDLSVLDEMEGGDGESKAPSVAGSASGASNSGGGTPKSAAVATNGSKALSGILKTSKSRGSGGDTPGTPGSGSVVSLLESMRSGGTGVTGDVDLDKLPKLLLSNRESTFVGELLRLSNNRGLRDLDGVTLLDTTHARFMYDDVQYHQVVMLALQMGVLTSLESLDLSSHKVGPRGAKVLSTNLAYNMSLSALLLDNSDIRSDGTIAISRALLRQRIKTVTTVDVSWCDIQDDGLVALCRVLVDVPTLESGTACRAAKKVHDDARQLALIKAAARRNRGLARLLKHDGGDAGASEAPDDALDASAAVAVEAPLSDEELDDGASETKVGEPGGVTGPDGDGTEVKAKRKGKQDTGIATGAMVAGAAAASGEMNDETKRDMAASLGDLTEAESDITPAAVDGDASDADTIDESKLKDGAPRAAEKPKLQFFSTAVSAMMRVKLARTRDRLAEKMATLDPVNPADPGAEDEEEKGLELPMSSGKLENLAVRGNKIGDVGWFALRIALPLNETLRSLVLSKNTISDDGIRYISNALPRNRALQSLELDSCQITPNGAVLLAHALRNSRLRRLSLCSDPFSMPLTVIGGVGVAALCRAAMYDSCGLEELRLNDCSPGLPGARAIGQLLMATTRLKLLDIACTLRAIVIPKDGGEFTPPKADATDLNLEKGERATMDEKPVASLKRIAEESGVPYSSIDRGAWEDLFVRDIPVAVGRPTTPSGAPAHSSAKRGVETGALTSTTDAESDDSVYLDSDGEEIDLKHAEIDYDLQMETIEFRVSAAQEHMWGIADRDAEDHRGHFTVASGGARPGGGYEAMSGEGGGVAMDRQGNYVGGAEAEDPGYGGLARFDPVDDDHVERVFALGTELTYLIARGLQKNNSLTTLNLRGNDIGVDGVGAIGRVLDNNRALKSTLEILDIGKNGIDAAAALRIIQRMTSTDKFKHVDLRGNNLEKEAIKRELRAAAGKYMAVHI